MGSFSPTRADDGLGNRTHKSFLSGILKEGWRETVYERDDFWAISVVRHEDITDTNITQREQEFKDFLYRLKGEFGSRISSVDTSNTAGSYFIVYLKKADNPFWTEEDNKELEDFYKRFRDKGYDI